MFLNGKKYQLKRIWLHIFNQQPQSKQVNVIKQCMNALSSKTLHSVVDNLIKAN